MLKGRLSFLIFWLGLWLVPPGQGATPFANGLSAWQAGQYEVSARAFAAELERQPSAEAWRNFGEAAWQSGHPGEAVLAWQRARWVNPYDTNAAACLQLAEGQGLFTPVPLTWLEAFSTWLPVNAWGGLAAGSFWLAVSLLLLPHLFGVRKRGWVSVTAALAAGVFLLTLPALAGVHTRLQLAVVPVANTPLRQTPTLTAQTLVRFSAGEMVRCKGVRSGYYYVQTANDTAGWVAREQLQFIAGPSVPAWWAGSRSP